ncbi:MAG: hypothetical protein OXU61_04275 [Gammaproteobacteria bacterium]|nr:hypothetical protein [Gammaproteobacteria bacterium]
MSLLLLLVVETVFPIFASTPGLTAATASFSCAQLHCYNRNVTAALPLPCSYTPGEWPINYNRIAHPDNRPPARPSGSENPPASKR